MEKNTLICTFDKAQYLCGEDVRIDLPPELIGGESQVTRLERPVPCRAHREGAALVRSGLGEGNYGVTIRHGELRWEGGAAARHALRLSDRLRAGRRGGG